MTDLGPAAQEQGALWSSSARDWAEFQEPVVLPAQRRTLDKLDIKSGDRLLDIGCGAAGALRHAADAGAEIHGLDAAGALLDIARERFPRSDFRLGDIATLPWPDHSFDVVVGFNSFQYAEDPVAAVGEARRVLVPGGRLGVVVWGSAAECEAVAHFEALAALLPPKPPGSPGPLAGEQAVADWIRDAGFTLTSDEAVDCPWHYPNRDHALRALMSAGPISRIVNAVGAQAVTSSLTECLERFRQPDGSYLFRNKFRSLTALA